MARSPEWISHCRYADVVQHFSNPVIVTNEKIIIWVVLDFEEEEECIFYCYFLSDMGICVEVLRPSQPNGVMSSTVSLPNHTFTGQA